MSRNSRILWKVAVGLAVVRFSQSNLFVLKSLYSVSARFHIRVEHVMDLINANFTLL